MNKQEARQILRRINELHFDINPDIPSEDQIKRWKEELNDLEDRLRKADFPVGIVHADFFIENCGRYVFIDDLR